MKTKQIIKSASIVLFSVVLFAIIPACNETEETKTEINTEELITVDIKVEGMTCGGCEKHITNAVMELNGINSAKLSHVDANAIVEFDQTQTTEKEIKDAINASGYKVVEE